MNKAIKIIGKKNWIQIFRNIGKGKTRDDRDENFLKWKEEGIKTFDVFMARRETKTS